VVKLEEYNVRGKKTLCRMKGEGKEKKATKENKWREVHTFNFISPIAHLSSVFKGREYFEIVK